MEVQAAQLAQQKSTSSEVKQFAAQVEKDHKSANDELQRIASAKGLTLPTSMNQDGLAQMKELNNLTGRAFDRVYTSKAAIQHHQKSIALYERIARESNDAEIRAFAEKTLPTLREHLKMAQAMSTSGDRSSTSSRSGSDVSPSSSSPGSSDFVSGSTSGSSTDSSTSSSDQTSTSPGEPSSSSDTKNPPSPSQSSSQEPPTSVDGRPTAPGGAAK